MDTIVKQELAAPLMRFLEANAVITRDRLLARRIRPFQRQVAAFFREQGRLFLREFAQLRPVIDAHAVVESDTLREQMSSSDWLPFWSNASRAVQGEFSHALETAILDALILGGGQLYTALNVDDDELIELGISWNLAHPRAVAHARQRAAEQVSKIDETTKSHLNSLISQATEEGWSYTRLSNAIGERFAEFATGGSNPRSRRVAVFELRDAYEAGNEIAVNELVDAGLEIEGKWLTVGPSARTSHRDSQAQGWRPLGFVFASGATRPPTDPGCRCSGLYRRKRP